MTATIDSHCAANAERHVSDLIEALRIPSISADPARVADVRRNAEFFADLATRAGFTTAEVLDTAGHPAVYAERIVDPALPTVLVYGHHDVQPVDPLDEWQSPPFEPAMRDGRLYARGAVDDKGQMIVHLKAVEAQLAVNGELPVNLKLLIEGEEEIGSANFESLVEREKERLCCDVVVVTDTAMLAENVPSICASLRGLVTAEIELRGPSLDLHSGVFGGAVQNPAMALARILAALKDPVTERVLVPGFYDSVRELSDSDRDAIRELPYDEAAFRAEAGGVTDLVGEEGFSSVERRWIRPTLEINGIRGGYQGPGSKTIVPGKAGAKISCRIVPDQTPADIAAKLETALRKLIPPGITARVLVTGGGNPVVTATDSVPVQAAVRAIQRVFGRPPVFTREGGSIPPAEVLQRVLGAPTVLLGFGLPDDQIHAPNEKFDLAMFQKGIRVIAHLWDELGSTAKRDQEVAP